MRPFRLHVISFALALLTPGVMAQQRATVPRVGYVYPAGGQQGATFDVTVGGQFLPTATGARITGQGILATVAGYDRPLTQREVQLLRDRLDEARKKLEGDASASRPGLKKQISQLRLVQEAGLTADEIRKLTAFQRSRTDPKQQLNPQIEEKVTLHVTIAADAAPGERELRLLTPTAATNPLRFEVGALPERRETEPNDRTQDGGTASLPLVLNGQIMPGDVDRYAFRARKGMQVVAAVAARELMPYLADAVPGWFQPVVAIYDPGGRELACADHYLFQPDPVVCCRIPSDGEYILEIRDSLYRGRDDFVYRITLGEVPFVTGLFPLGGRQGAAATVALSGWNLPETSVSVCAQAAGVTPLGVSAGHQPSNVVPFAVDTLPEILEREPNNGPTQAQRISLPAIVNGRIDRPGDTDVFAFEAGAGSVIIVEVMARRLGSPLDSAIRLTDWRGREIAANDDFDDESAALITHQADSRIQVKLPAAGLYFLALRDAQQKGGPDYAYRLRLSAPAPDFDLRTSPSSLSARAGATIPITVTVFRKDGFDGDITLSLRNGPPGFVLSGGFIPAGVNRIRMTLSAPPFGRPDPFSLTMEGRATIGDRDVVRPVTPAEDMMQAFAYHKLVPAQEWLLTVFGRTGGRAAQPRASSLLRLPPGGTIRIPLPGASSPAAARLQFALDEPPEGITLQHVADRNGEAFVFRADSSKVKAGQKGNLIIGLFAAVSTPGAGGKPAGPARLVPVGMLPAIPYEIVAPAATP